ncbi:MAG: hypothetical protein LBC04_01575 [Holosporaceae bacterium]|jgi:phage/plasmid primase-like uncharacterized protein|nr:hypothetical protein [Holosporaceae bacterium]
MSRDDMVNFEELKSRYRFLSRDEKIVVLQRLIPGRETIQGSDYVALNPGRNDSKPGSFRIDIETGKFHDFASGNKGGSIIDLTAFAYGCDLPTAAKKLSDIIGNNSVASCSKISSFVAKLAKKKKINPNYIWSKSFKSEDHEYLKRKRISIGNAKVNCYQDKKQLVIPLIDSIPENKSNLCIKGLQFIREDGSKSFPMPFKELFYVASDYDCKQNTIVLAEGYATACSISNQQNYIQSPLYQPVI